MVILLRSGHGYLATIMFLVIVKKGMLVNLFILNNYINIHLVSSISMEIKKTNDLQKNRDRLAKKYMYLS